MLAPHLPLEIIDIILQYDGRIKYRNGEFVNIIHPNLLKMYNTYFVGLLLCYFCIFRWKLPMPEK